MSTHSHRGQAPLRSVSDETGVDLRAAAFDDFPVVRDLFEGLHRYNAGLDPRFALAEHWETHLYGTFCDGQGHHDQLWLLAFEDAVPVGLLWAKQHRGTALFQQRHWVELNAIFVSPQTRAQGVGRALLDELKVWTAAHGERVIQAFVTASNHPALAFYEREGFHHSQSIVRLLLEH